MPSAGVDVGRDDLRARRHLLGLLVAHRARRDVEEVDLAVDGAQVAGGVEERRDVGDEAAGRRLVDGPGEQPDAAPGRHGGEGAVGRSVRSLRRGDDALAAALERPRLRQGDEAGALVGRRLDQLERRRARWRPRRRACSAARRRRAGRRRGAAPAASGAALTRRSLPSRPSATAARRRWSRPRSP